MLLISLALFGLASLASAFSPSLGFLARTRFFIGAGIAGGFAGSVALTGDHTPHRLRAIMIMLTFIGAPLGGCVGGLVVSFLLAQGFGWPIIYIIGGAFPLVLIAIAAFHRALLQRLDIAHVPGEAHGLDIAQGNPIRMLFGEGYALQTTLLWIIFFCSLLDLFLFIFWLPEGAAPDRHDAGPGGVCDEPLHGGDGGGVGLRPARIKPSMQLRSVGLTAARSLRMREPCCCERRIGRSTWPNNLHF